VEEGNRGPLSLSGSSGGGGRKLYIRGKMVWSLQSNPTGTPKRGRRGNIAARDFSWVLSRLFDGCTGVRSRNVLEKTGVRSRPKSLTGVSKYKYSCLGSRNKNGSSTFFFSLERTKTFIVIDLSCWSNIFNEKCAQVNVFSLERAKTFIAYLMKNFENKNIYSIFNEKYAQVKFCPQRINTCSVI
jgi:hypothetical protein